jgi:MFS transporter, Spinster family, sphingosine-1-phosphate transporter
MPKIPSASDAGYLFGKKNAYFILFVVCLLMMINYMDRQVFSVVQESIRIDMGLNDTQMGMIGTFFALGMGLFALPIAYLVDKWSRNKAIGIMSIAWSGLTFITGLGVNFVTVLIPRTLVGIGEAGYTSGGTPLITAAFPERLRATVMGILNMVLPIGSIIGLTLGGYLAVKTGTWRMPFYVFGAIGIVAGILAFFLKDYKNTEAKVLKNNKRENVIDSAISLLKIPTLLRLYVGFAMMQVMMMSMITWIPTFIIRAQGVKADYAGLLTGGITLFGIVGAILGGIVADKWQVKNPRSRMLLPAIVILIGTVLAILTLLFDVKGIGFIFGCCMMLAFLMAIAPLTAVTQDVTPMEKRGQAWGLNSFMQYFLGGGWAPLVAGALSDYLGAGGDGLKIALIITSCFGFIAAILYFLGSRHYLADMQKAQQYVYKQEAN